MSTVAPLTPSRVSNCRLDQLSMKPPQSPKRICVSGPAPAPSPMRSSSSNLRAMTRSVSGEKPEEEQSCVRVAVRVRPFTTQELQLVDNRCAVRFDDGCVVVDSDAGLEAGEVRFSFDHCFWSFSREQDLPFASQEMVYETLGSPLVDKALEGFNVCLFAYGMTSSGKSYR